MKATRRSDGAVTLVMNGEEADAMARLTLWHVDWMKVPISEPVFRELKSVGASDLGVEDEPKAWGVTPNA